MKVVLTRKRFIGATAVLTAAYLILLITWAYVTPAFRSPDAPMHYNSIMRLVNGGGWPDPGTARIDEGVLTVGKEGGLVSAEATGFNQRYFSTVPDGLIQGTGDQFPWIHPLPEDDRAVPEFGDGYTSGIDQMTQHPPVYYGIAAGYLKVLGADHWQWDGQLLALRVLSALMVMWVVPATVYTARKTGLGRRLSLFAGLGIFAIPQLAHVGSSITNDSLYILVGALVLAQSARVLFGNPTKRDVVISGLLLGLGLWTKATFLVFGLVVGLSFVLARAAIPAGRKWLYGVSAGMLGVVVGGLWWVRNLIVYGSLQPSGMKIAQADWGTESPDLRDFLPIAWTDFVESFWGKYGWLEIPLPSWMIPTLTLCAVAMAILGFIAAKGRRTALSALLLFPVLVFAIILGQSWLNYVYTGQVAGMQGRYIFPAISALAVLVAWCFVSLRRQLEPRFAQIAECVYVISVPLIASYGVWWMLQTVYRDNDELLKFSWTTWDGWSIATGATLKLWVGATLGIFAIIMIVGCYLARACKHGDTPPAHVYPTHRDIESLERTGNQPGHVERDAESDEFLKQHAPVPVGAGAVSLGSESHAEGDAHAGGIESDPSIAHGSHEESGVSDAAEQVEQGDQVEQDDQAEEGDQVEHAEESSLDDVRTVDQLRGVAPVRPTDDQPGTANDDQPVVAHDDWTRGAHEPEFENSGIESAGEVPVEQIERAEPQVGQDSTDLASDEPDASFDGASDAQDKPE